MENVRSFPQIHIFQAFYMQVGADRRHFFYFSYYICVMKGFVGNFFIFRRNLYRFFQEKPVSPTINP